MIKIILLVGIALVAATLLRRAGARHQAMVRALVGLNIVGADVVEVSPPYDPSGNTALVAATLMYEMLCLFARRSDSTGA